jgi:hypothetical protein
MINPPSFNYAVNKSKTIIMSFNSRTNLNNNLTKEKGFIEF